MVDTILLFQKIHRDFITAKKKKKLNKKKKISKKVVLVVAKFEEDTL